MYSARINTRLPQVYRVCRPAACQTARTLSLAPRFVSSDFAPIFRLMDDFTNQVTSRLPHDGPTFSNIVRSFNPRFDVKETNDAYELVGELPGIDQKDINIEFTDAQTISIKGRTETYREQGRKPEAEVKAVEAENEQTATLPTTESSAEADNVSTAASETSSYHQPTVEDEDGVLVSAADTETVSAATPATTEAGPSNEVAETEAEPAAAQETQPKTTSHYWISERSVGQFHRSFAFPGRVDQENVHASLKDGILSIIVPKAAIPQNRRIDIL